jgi:hypothetical protein
MSKPILFALAWVIPLTWIVTHVVDDLGRLGLATRVIRQVAGS